MEAGRSLSDADARYLARIRADCAGWLGPGTELLELWRERDLAGVRLIARYRLGREVRESAAVGDSLLTAHGVLRARILFDRLRFGLSDAVEPHHATRSTRAP